MTLTSRSASFYSNLDPENFNFDTIESVDHEAIRKLIRTLETALVAYAKSRNKTGMKHDAAMYADQVAVFGKQHPAAPYANMEIRLRKLELLCLDTRRAELPMFQDFIASLEQQLAEAEQRWRKYFANCGAGLLTGP